MSFKKTIRVPLASDGIPVMVDRHQLERTREIPVAAPPPHEDEPGRAPAQGTPNEILSDEITVPVHSSIESSLTFEVLRRQSTDDDDSDGKPKP